MNSMHPLAGVKLLLLLARVAGAQEDSGGAASDKNCTISPRTRFTGHLSKAWIGNDADSYFPIFSHPPIFVNGTDMDFSEACRTMCLARQICNRWSFWHARRGIGGLCFIFPANATAAEGGTDWEGGWCVGDKHDDHEDALDPDDVSDVAKVAAKEVVRLTVPWVGVVCATATLVFALSFCLWWLRERCKGKLKHRKSFGMPQKNNSAGSQSSSQTVDQSSDFGQAWDAELGQRAPAGVIDPLAKQPTQWGMTVEQLALFQAIHRDRMASYCRDHRRASDNVHVCRHLPCNHNHGAARWRPHCGDDCGDTLEELEPTMHLVVDLIIKPFTNVDGATLGYAPLLNKANPLKPTVFVSHCWNERFPDFVATLTNHLPPTTVVWICSFALPQNLDINALIGQGNLSQSPFAQALLSAQRLFLVVDERLLPLDRVWCLFEMYICCENQIRLDVRAPTMSKFLFRNILRKIEVMDIRQCSAASVADRERIMSAVRGSEEKLNCEVRQSIEELVRLMESVKD